MRTKLPLMFALVAAAALALGLVLWPRGAAAAPTPLTGFNGTHSGPRASNVVAPNDRPTIFKIDQTRTVNPSLLPPGGSATFSTKIRVNPYAANCPNICCLIQSIYELGLKPKFYAEVT